MSTSFWCSGCKKDHPGDCSPSQGPPPGQASFPNRAISPRPGVTTGKGLSFGGASAPLGPSAPSTAPSMPPDEFDALVDLYEEMDSAELTDHYRAAKEALFRKLGAAARSSPVPP